MDKYVSEILKHKGIRLTKKRAAEVTIRWEQILSLKDNRLNLDEQDIALNFIPQRGYISEQ